MQCEICGKNAGKGVRIEMDGIEMIACSNCSRFGKPIAEPQKAGKKIFFEKPAGFEELVFADDFGKRIKNAREKRQLPFEELSKLVGEKMSVLRKIESGHQTPTNELARRLEKALGIEIIERSS